MSCENATKCETEPINEVKYNVVPQELIMTESEFENYINNKKIYNETFKSPKTHILNFVNFKNEQDAEVWKRLPLSDRQKEELLVSLYMPDLLGKYQEIPDTDAEEKIPEIIITPDIPEIKNEYEQLEIVHNILRPDDPLPEFCNSLLKPPKSTCDGSKE